VGADGEQLQGKPLVPPGLQFAGRPRLIARKPGRGTGRSLLLDGHINVVSAEPRSSWTSDPFTPEVHNGNRYGRGACDMKGGIAAMVFAVETLASLGVELEGDLVVATNTDGGPRGRAGRCWWRAVWRPTPGS
jgi:acetylornithine deacetylase